MKILQNQNFKIFLFFFLTLSLTSQSQNRYGSYANGIEAFSKPFRVLSNYVDKNGNGSIEYTNPKNQVLRFRLFNHKPQLLHSNIVYQLFYYEKDFLKRIDTYDINEKPAGERESENEATVIFIVEKPELYLQKKKIIDEAEGNIDMKDDSSEKIIRIQLLDSDYLPVKEDKPQYISSKMYWEYNIRKYWP